MSVSFFSFHTVLPTDFGVSLFFKWNPVFSFTLLSEFTSRPSSSMVLGGEGWGRSLSKLWPTWRPAAGWSWNWVSLEITGFSVANFGSHHCQCCWSVFPCHTGEIRTHFLALCRGQVWVMRAYRPLFSDFCWNYSEWGGVSFNSTMNQLQVFIIVHTDCIMFLVWIHAM